VLDRHGTQTIFSKAGGIAVCNIRLYLNSHRKTGQFLVSLSGDIEIIGRE